MNSEQERRARNEALFREVNERVEEVARRLSALEDESAVTGFVCECSREDCTDLVEITSSQYEAVRSDPRRFLLRHGHEDLTVDRVVAVMEGQAALPRKNGELVFEEPWQGRVFGMAVALHERGLYDWEEFRQTLIAQVAAAEARGGPFVYYEIWLQTFEELLARKRLVTGPELDETTYQFEFGERDEVY